MRYSTFFFILLSLGFIFLGIAHERIHVSIYDKYGINSEVTYWNSLPTLTTIPESRCETDMCSFANSLNEIIGYYLILLYIIFGISKFYDIRLKEDHIT